MDTQRHWFCFHRWFPSSFCSEISIMETWPSFLKKMSQKSICVLRDWVSIYLAVVIDTCLFLAAQKPKPEGVPVLVAIVTNLWSKFVVILFGSTSLWTGKARIERANVEKRVLAGYWLWNSTATTVCTTCLFPWHHNHPFQCTFNVDTSSLSLIFPCGWEYGFRPCPRITLTKRFRTWGWTGGNALRIHEGYPTIRPVL